MNIVYSVLVTIAVLVAIAFSLLVLVTGKGDAMNGGGSVRTSFKGKASFDDIMSKWTLYLGVAFMALILVVDILAKQVDRANAAPVIETNTSVQQSVPASNAPAANVPATNAPATNLPTPTTNAPTTPAPATNAPATGATNTGVSGIGNASGNLPLDSTPATTPGASTEPTVVPTIPGATNGAGSSAGVSTGGTNAPVTTGTTG